MPTLSRSRVRELTILALVLALALLGPALPTARAASGFNPDPTIPAGKNRGITVRVRSRCLSLLRAASHHRIKAKFTSSLGTGQQGVPKQIPLILG